MTNYDIIEHAKKYLNEFRGVFMRDSLPRLCKSVECGVINLDSFKNNGTHWCAYYKCKKNCMYFDSFGNLPPPIELVHYLGSSCRIVYNYDRYQDFNTIICGQLCLLFLYEIQNMMKENESII